MAEYVACILGLRMALDMDSNDLLVIGDSDLLIHQVQGEWATKNDKILPYVNLAQRLCKRFKKVEFRHTPRAQNEFSDALATIASIIQHPKSSRIDPLEITLREEHANCSHVEAEPDDKPRYNDIKLYLKKWEYPEVIPAEVEIPSSRIIQEAELDNAEWVQARYEQLALIDEKGIVMEWASSKVYPQVSDAHPSPVGSSNTEQQTPLYHALS
ncbi:uncharacterized protein LOC132061334 [Lycium ferocissimum]|uniref:uncharacterized protein LOC132061334 n=1 Tax=Lycium ferocissimum TaxID=112874 RepID=UPI0028160B50|nr:uncharacterized protein LOC132061334 [Lycium ferocissimum]